MLCHDASFSCVDAMPSAWVCVVAAQKNKEFWIMDQNLILGLFYGHRRVLGTWSRAVLRMLFFSALFLMPTMAQAVVNLKITKLADEGTVASGATITYRIQYTVASTTENAINAVITDVLPVELAASASDVTLEGDDFVESAL